MNIKKTKLDFDDTLDGLANTQDFKYKKYSGENLDVDYSVIFSKNLADELLEQLEERVEYFSGDLTKVKVFGKWHNIPRQQVAYGDDGMKYTFSGTTIPAKPWLPILLSIRNFIEKITGYSYNFVLVNKYRDGRDYIGEHRDDEKELDKNIPIASISFGQTRNFVLKHRDARKKGDEKRIISTVKIDLQHGSLLLMNPPTNEYWYHSIPQRKQLAGIRINLTFRKINM